MKFKVGDMVQIEGRLPRWWRVHETYDSGLDLFVVLKRPRDLPLGLYINSAAITNHMRPRVDYDQRVDAGPSWGC